MLESFQVLYQQENAHGIAKWESEYKCTYFQDNRTTVIGITDTSVSHHHVGKTSAIKGVTTEKVV